jgi:hypothetical protein
MGSISSEGPQLLALQRRDNFVVVVAAGGSADTVLFNLVLADPRTPWKRRFRGLVSTGS